MRKNNYHTVELLENFKEVIRKRVTSGVKHGYVVKLCFFTILSMYILLETIVYNAIPCQ